MPRKKSSPATGTSPSPSATSAAAAPSINPSIPPLPFSPAPNESHKAFETFLCYFDIGQNRSFAKVSRLAGVNLSSVKMWAHRFNWRDRVRAYNTELLRTRLAVETGARRDRAELQSRRAVQFQEAEWRVAEKLLRAAQNVLDTLLHKNPDKLTLSDAGRALEIASRIGRLSLDLATDKQEFSGPGGGPIQIQFQAALNKIYGQPLPDEVVDVSEEPDKPKELPE